MKLKGFVTAVIRACFEAEDLSILSAGRQHEDRTSPDRRDLLQTSRGSSWEHDVQDDDVGRVLGRRAVRARRPWRR
jgi:hypothetical protein